MTNEVLMCTECPDQPATMRYRWPWDSDWSACSSQGQFLLRQKGERLKRLPEFLPLVAETDPEARPLGLSERQQMHAARLAAEDELKAQRERATRLYNQTVELTTDVKSFKLAAEQANTQLVAKSEELGRAVVHQAKLGSQVVDLTEQLAVANRLLQSQQAETQELDSLRRQLNESREALARLNGELLATREKHDLHVAELTRELEAARAEQ